MNLLNNNVTLVVVVLTFLVFCGTSIEASQRIVYAGLLLDTSMPIDTATNISTSSSTDSLSFMQQKYLFEEFKTKFGSYYFSESEENFRFKVFLKNIQKARERNLIEIQNGGSECHGITKFSDLTEEEFVDLYLFSEENTQEERSPVIQKPMLEITNRSVVEIAKKDDNDNKNGKNKKDKKKDNKGKDKEKKKTLVDWTGIYTNPVRDQGVTCQSCWIHSATQQVESDAMRTLNFKDGPLSVQQTLSCLKRYYYKEEGYSVPVRYCGGGQVFYAYDYIKESGGLQLEAEYPYIGGETAPSDDSSRPHVDDPDLPQCRVGTQRVTLVDYITPTDITLSVSANEISMANYLETTGPLSICVNALPWQTYVGGVLTDCKADMTNHCVQLVGIDRHADQPYWKIRNSYGTDFGEDGYVRVLYGQNSCSLTKKPTYTIVKLV